MSDAIEIKKGTQYSPLVGTFHEHKKRTISLDTYLKMQNDWLMLVTKDDSDKGNDHTPEQLVAASRGMVDALLKHNNVTVEE